MGKQKAFKKLRQYARKESMKNFKAIEYDACLMMILKPKPKHLPWWVWTRIVKLVIRQQNGKKKRAQKEDHSQTDQEDKGIDAGEVKAEG